LELSLELRLLISIVGYSTLVIVLASRDDKAILKENSMDFSDWIASFPKNENSQ